MDEQWTPFKKKKRAKRESEGGGWVEGGWSCSWRLTRMNMNTETLVSAAAVVVFFCRSRWRVSGWVGGRWCESRGGSQPDQRRHSCSLRHRYPLLHLHPPSLPPSTPTHPHHGHLIPYRGWPHHCAHARSHTPAHGGQSLCPGEGSFLLLSFFSLSLQVLFFFWWEQEERLFFLF